MKEKTSKRLSSSFAVIEKYIRSDDLSAEHETVSENFHIISLAYRLIGKKCLDKSGVYERIEKYLARNAWKYEKASFYEFFAGTGFTLSEVYALQSALSASLIVSIADEINASSARRRMNGKKLISSVLSLHKTSRFDSGECFEKLCPIENALKMMTPEYENNDDESKDRCRDALIRYAKDQKMTESEALSFLADNGKSVYDLTETKKGGAAWFYTLCFLIFAFLTASSFAYFGWVTVFIAVPLYLSSCFICDRVFSRCLRSAPPLRLGLTEVPDDAGVLCVTASLLFGREKDSELFDKLETFYLKNMKKNVYFGVLADFPDSKEKCLHSDASAAFYASERIKELNEKYGDVFVFLLRDRTLNANDGTYGGRERKRGAVCDLVEYITDGRNGFSLTVNAGCLSGIRYVMTLDSDTNLPINGVLDLLNVALHPANRPLEKDGRIVKGYGIFQPRMKTGFRASYSTYYTLLESEDGGFYERASYDRYQSLFGTGMFCGKGMFDVKLFRKYIIPAFPQNRILSHDIPEGCILRCMFVSDVVFTDSGPKNAVSSFTRLHRWIRGDMQNAYFLLSKHIDGVGKFKIIENMIRHSSPLLSSVGIFVSAFSGAFGEAKAILFFAVSQSSLILPSLSAFFARLFGKAYTPRRYFTKSFTSLWKNAVRLTVQLSSVVENAYRSADAIIRTVWRTCVSKKKLLEWVTFSQSDGKGSGFACHVSELIVSAFAGVLLFAFSANAVFRLFGFFTFAFPLLSYALSFVIPEKTVKVSSENKKLITKWARDAFRYFDERVGPKSNYLPPDNVQLSPSDRSAERTSPTNIGLYLLSTAAAADFGFITRDDAVERMKKTVFVVEKLKKYRGHLYNWYDTRSLDVIGNEYVSSVDSGNFVTMMITLAETLDGYNTQGASATASRVRSLAYGADFSFLYDKSKKLLSLGFSEKNGLDGISYDMLMSEVRTTCYYLCAYGIVPTDMWFSLSRDVGAKNGYIGMLSWSGSAFEYFMPELFLATPANSFIDESLEFAFYNQRIYKRNGLWGISESAYYSFDTDMNYQYKAHGVPSLAMKKYDEKEFVVSPYSLFIMMNRDVSACVRQLEETAERGSYGEYGFFESIDLTEGSENVRCYMSHHIGMSVVACANVCFDGIFTKRFMRDKRIAASSELLDEKIPTGVRLYKRAKNVKLNGLRRDGREEGEDARCGGVIRSGNASIFCTRDGRVSLRYGSYRVNDDEGYGIYFGAVCNGAASVFPSPGTNVTVRKEKHGFSLVSADPSCPSVVRYGLSDDGKAFVINVRTDNSKKTKICMYFRPVLDKAEKYASHPAYSKLFVVSEYIADEGVIIFRRKGRPFSKDPLVGVALCDPQLKFDFRTDEECFCAHSRRYDGSLFEVPYDQKTGTCVNPACFVKTEVPRRNEVTFLIVPSYGVSECVSWVRDLRVSPQNPASAAAMTELADICVSRCLEKRNVKGFKRFDSSVLWKSGVSGDVPLMTLVVISGSVSAVSSFISAFRALTTSFERCELLFLVNEEPSYSTPLSDLVKDCVAEMGCERFLFKRNGIFIASLSAFTDEETEFIRSYSAIFHESDSLCPRDEPKSKEYKMIKTRSDSERTERIIADNVSVSGKHPLPRSFVLASRSLGTVLTSKTLGFTFFGNAHDKRISRFDGDPYSECYGERLLAYTESGIYDIVAISERVEFRPGKAIYYGAVPGADYTVTVCVSPSFPIKLIKVDFYGKIVKTAYRVTPSERSCVGITKSGRKAFFKGLKAPYSSYAAFIKGIGNASCHTGNEYEIDENDPSSVWCVSEESESLYLLGAAPCIESAEKIISLFDRRRFDEECEKAVRYAYSFIPPHGLYTDNGEADAIYRVFSPYQTAFSRFFGKTGFYQTGGAFGFRDQLQDCLCLVYSRPDVVKTHLFRSAAHQYREGDVMHWWFPDNGKSHGIRSKCSDDLLFLPFVCADYVRKTGDISVLTKRLPYMCSPPLEENERYETPEYAKDRESLYMHCLRAIFRAYSRTGEHRLCLMGSCDWNDGISAAGEKGKGESVFSTLFLSLAAKAFIPMCELMKDPKSRSYLEEICFETVSAVNGVWDGDRYPRGTFDDGTFFGVENAKECKIDLLSQSFAAIVMGKNERTIKAMDTAYGRLFDKDKKIFRLFDPPFDKIDAGYISAYPQGIRENGGQYTHGALWGVWGLASVGEYAKAIEVLDSIMPYSHSSSDVYKLESYVIPADIYSSGRGGWSWYTGSASWYFRIMTEVVLGLDFTNGFNTVSVKPLREYTFITERNGYKLKVISSKREKCATLDGNACVFPLDIPKGEHIIKLPPVT